MGEGKLSDPVRQSMVAVYLSTIAPSALAFIFWIIVGNISGPGTIGVITAVGAFSVLIAVFGHLDVPVGARTFLGKAFAEKDWPKFKNITSAAAVFTTFTLSLVLVITLNPFLDILDIIGIDKQFIPILIIITFGNNLINIFSGVLTSALKSKKIFIPYTLGGISRFVVLFIALYFFGSSDINTGWAFSASFALSGLMLLFITTNFLRGKPGKFFGDFSQNVKLVVKGSIARWIPQIVTVIGMQLSILSVFALKGASEGGLFYVSFSIFNLLLMISRAIITVSHPVMSGMEQISKQERFFSKSLRFSFLVTLPLAAVMFFYAEPILSVFGKEFSLSENTLSLLMASFPFVIITEAFIFLIFARRDFHKLFYLGLSSSITKVILYFILVPEYGTLGAAGALLIGTLTQMVLTIIIAKHIKVKIQYKIFIFISTIPFAVGYSIQLLNTHDVIGAIAIFTISYIIYAKIKLIVEQDIESAFRSITGENKAKQYANSIVINLKKLHIM